MCILALDQGTTSSRAIVFGKDGRPIAVAQKEFEQIFPQPGHVEHDPEAIWKTQSDVAREALTEAGRRASDVAAIGVTNQRETTILWERRTRQAGRQRHRLAEPRDAPACVIDSRPTATKTRFATRRASSSTPISPAPRSPICSTRSPDCAPRAEKGEILFGTVDTFLTWRLTGGKRHVTDYSNASRTLIYNIHTLDWDDELLRILNIPRAMLPEVPTVEHRLRRDRSRELFGGAFRSPRSSAISRRPRSARPASNRAAPKTPTARAVSCC